jgi:hypothetical protein
MKYRLFVVVLAVAAVLVTGRRGAAQEEFPFEIFGRYLESLVPHIGMPGVSAAIIQTPVNGRPVIRQYNIGYADLERKIPTRFDTPYPIGGVTQAMTGVLHGVCIDRFTTSVFNIDNDIRSIVPAFPFAGTSIRQVLSHSTDGRFRYDTALFNHLTHVVESPLCLDQPFRKAIATEVLDRIPGGMRRSVPGMDINRPEGAAARALFDDATVRRYQDVLNELAVPYRIDDRGRASRSDYTSFGLDATTGMVSTVEDLVNFEIQLDRRDGVPFSSSTIDKMWSNQSFDLPIGAGGSTVKVVMPTGLGWFVTVESSQTLVWTFGHIRDAASALIMLANSGGLANGYNLENATVTSSPFVKVFLRLFI